MAKIMEARYPGRCAGCRGEILPGTSIRFEGRGRSFHADATVCAGVGDTPDDYSNINPVTGGRMSNRSRVNTVRFAGGATFTRNSRGRCIDAPCCGCCTI